MTKWSTIASEKRGGVRWRKHYVIIQAEKSQRNDMCFFSLFLHCSFPSHWFTCGVRSNFQFQSVNNSTNDFLTFINPLV